MKRKRVRRSQDRQVLAVMVLVTVLIMAIVIAAAPSYFANLLSQPDNGDGTSSQDTLQLPGTDGGGGNNGDGGSNDCVLAAPCSITDTNCKPSFTKISCDDPACKNSPAFCVQAPKTSTDNSGGGNNDTNGGGGNGGSNDCILPITCSATDTNCKPSFTKISCNDPACMGNVLCISAPSTSGSNDNGSGNGNTGNGNSGDNGTSGGQQGNGSDNSGNNGPNLGTNPPSSQPTSETKGSNDNGLVLGCFTKDGSWTSDRTKCDPNQMRHMQTGQAASNGQQTSQAVQTTIQQDQEDAALQSQLDAVFHTQQERDAAYSGLVNAATTALTHMNTLAAEQLPDAAMAAVTSTSDWLKQLLSNLSSSEPTVSDMQQQSAEMKNRLQQTESILASTVSVTAPKPQDLTDPIEKIIDTMPTVFQFLTAQGVQLSQETATEYDTAANLYKQDKPLCLQNSDTCLQMQDVITHLSSMRDDLEATLQQQNKTNLEPQIDQMLQ